MLKVIAFTLGCSKFLLLVLNVESSYSYFWILKVFTFALALYGFEIVCINIEGYVQWGVSQNPPLNVIMYYPL
jgi:hypothetical protein